GSQFAMGQTLSEPVTNKDTSLKRSPDLTVGTSSMQGWRVHMEDAHSSFLSLPGHLDTAYFAVFDGHGGSKVAKYAAANLHRKILAQPSFPADPSAAMERGFLALDEEMQNCKETRDELAGSTALAIILREGRVWCASAGDSRAVMSVCGLAVELSRDHKPSNETEKARIQAAGGWVDLNRVNGNLALSRALGDFVFKRNTKKSAEEQIVTAKPDVTVNDVTPDVEFIVLACDGIWDVLTNQEVVNFVRVRLAQEMDPDVVCEDLMMQCLAPDCHNSGLGCDNMTVMIIGFLHRKGSRHLFQACARPPKSRSVYLPM
ncbi:hypothetical protein BOX15_Mlig032573g1, partial [Macrostomum lignano]